MSIRPEQKEQVRQATDLVRLVGEHLKLTPKGREFVGVCPFHDDSNPSMCVVPAKQIYHCFVCNAGGDAISWMINYHKMSFPDAVRFLADRAGIVLDEDQSPQARQQAQQASDERKAIAAANEQALAFFTQALQGPNAQSVREYLTNRGITDDMIQAFGIGYAPDSWDALSQSVTGNQRQRQNIRQAMFGFEQAHLCRKRSDGSHFDFFRHRLMFPVFDALNRPIAFGGRKLREEDNPKYINSPEHRLFHKSATLYGIHRAKKPIMDTRTAVIVEGYTDVIACHQHGAENAVATLGTALTEQHVRELKKYADQIVLIFDGDAAGQKAADRALELFLSQELDVKICVLPGGQDPADFLEESGIESWQKAISDAKDALTYQYQSVQTQLNEATTLTQRDRVLNQYIDSLLDMGMAKTGPFRTAFFVKRLNQLTGVSETELADLIRSRSKTKRPTTTTNTTTTNTNTTHSNKPSPNAPYNAGPETFDPAFASDHDDPAFADYDGPLPDDFAGDFAGDRPSNLNSAAKTSANPATHATTPPATHATNFAEESAADQDQLSPGTPDFIAAPKGSFQNQANAKRAAVVAEKQLIGCLIQDNSLFDQPMSDGISIDEALPSAALSTQAGQQLYEQITQRLIEGQSVTLAALLGDLAQHGQHDLIRLATESDQFVEQACEDKPELRRQMILGAAQALRQLADQQDNQPLQAADPNDPIAQAKALQNLLQNQLAPSPTRIGRTSH